MTEGTISIGQNDTGNHLLGTCQNNMCLILGAGTGADNGQRLAWAREKSFKDLVPLFRDSNCMGFVARNTLVNQNVHRLWS